MRPQATAAAVVALVALAGGCASTSASSNGADPPSTLARVQSGTVKISARDNSFIAQNVTVTVGSTVVWANDGRNDHNIIPVGATPFRAEAADFAPKATYEFVAQEPGTYEYYCSIHGTSTKGMIGTVQVVPA